MVDDFAQLPAGNPERQEPNAAAEDRLLLAVRNARVRAMIAREEAPPGFRISDDRTGFVRLGNPAWPVRPLDPHCTVYGEPSIELTLLIRKVFPDFDPELGRRAWLEVAEFVRRRGRPVDELHAMGHEALVAFFRVEISHSDRRGPAECEVPAVEEPPRADGGPDAHKAASSTTKPRETTRKILRRMMDDDQDWIKLKRARTAEQIGQLIGKKPSTVKGTHPEWDEVQKRLKMERLAKELTETSTRGRNP